MAKAFFSRLLRIAQGDESGDAPGLDAGTSRLERFVHFWALVARSFVRNRCPLRASALSYSTLLALIPLLAVALSVTSSLLKQQGEDKIYQGIDRMVANVMPPATVGTNGETVTNSSAGLHGEPIPPGTLSDTNAAAAAQESRVVSAQKEAAQKIENFVQNAQSKTLGVTGMILLVLVAIQMLANVEMTFNDIWGVTRGRSWYARIVQYWTAITLGPLLVACALGLASGAHLETTRTIIDRMPVIGGLVFHLLPLVMLWLTFALFYQLIPATKVHFSAALVGGVVAGTFWHLNNLFGFLYVSRVVTNSKIYGGLGLVPVFMAGLYFSWIIVLFGAQVAYAFQNRVSYLQEKLAENVNHRGREFIALRLMTSLGQRFQRGDVPGTIVQLSTELNLPSRLVQQVLRTLMQARLVVEAQGKDPGYSPARPLESITAHHILMAMRSVPGQELSENEGPARSEVLGEFARIEQAEEQAASVVTVQTLVNRVRARLELLPPEDGKKSPPAA